MADSKVPPPPRWYATIEAKLIISMGLLFLVVLASIEAVAYWGLPFTEFEGRRAQYRREAFRKLDLIADLKKELLVRWLNERREDIHVLTGNDLIQQSVRQMLVNLEVGQRRGIDKASLWASVSGSSSATTLRRYLALIRARYGIYRHLQIVNASSGVVLVSTKKEWEGNSSPGQDAIRGALAEPDRAWVSGVQRDYERGLGHQRLSISRAIVAERDRAPGMAPAPPIAVLVADVDTEEIIRPMLHTGGGLGDRGESLLVDRDTKILTTLKHPLANGSMAVPLEHRIRAQPAVLAAKGEEGIIEAKDYRDVDVLAAYRHVRVSTERGWGMVVKMDQAEVYAPLREDATDSLLAGFAGLLALTGLLLVVARSITRPLTVLSAAADRISAGDLDLRVDEEARDEIGQLAGAFNRMTEALSLRHAVDTSVGAVSTILASPTDLDAVLEEALSRLLADLRCQSGAVFLADADGWLSLYASVGIDPEQRGQARVKVGEGLVGLAARGDAVVLHRDIPDEPPLTLSYLGERWRPQTIVTAPLRLQDRLVGVLTLAGLYPLPSAGREILDLVGPQLAVAISNARAVQETYSLAERLKLANAELKSQAVEQRAHAQELERQRELVERANKLKSQFLANMSHELRTPLNSITALSSVMLADRESGAHRISPEKEQVYLQTVVSDAKLLLSLIDDLLDLAKIEAGKIVLHTSTFELADALAPAVSALRSLADDKGLELAFDCPLTLPRVRADPDKVRQVLLNLGGNAIKFTDSGGVRIICSPRGARVAVSVIDTGIGFASTDAEVIFEEFKQLNGTSTRMYSGTGLGLSISRRLARAMGGEVEVESIPGAGTTFTLTLPTADAAGGDLHESDDAVQAASTQQVASSPLARHGALARHSVALTLPQTATLLLVEDNPQSLLALRAMLESYAWTLRDVRRGDEVLAKAREVQPDAILLDLELPGLSGYEVVRLLRKDPALQRIPVVAVTAQAMPADRQNALDSGCRDYVTKPVDAGALRAALERCLGTEPE